MPRFSRILCPIDFDPNSLLALRLASEMARERKATLHLLHVVAIRPGPEVSAPFQRLEALARGRLERLARQKLGEAISYQLHIRTGDPSVEVLRTAKEVGASLIVIATHGRKGLRRLVLGSVTESVIREAPCPVLTIKPVPRRFKVVPARARPRRAE